MRAVQLLASGGLKSSLLVSLYNWTESDDKQLQQNSKQHIKYPENSVSRDILIVIILELKPAVSIWKCLCSTMNNEGYAIALIPERYSKN